MLAQGAARALVRAVCLSVYALAMLVFLRDYAAIEWPFYGYAYVGVSRTGIAVLVGFLIAISAFLPGRIESPSSLALIVICLFVLVPAAVCAVGMPQRGGPNPNLMLLSLGVSFIIACVTNRGSSDPGSVVTREPHPLFILLLVALAVLTMAFLIYRFRDIMSFASLDTLYEQREKGAATNVFEGYTQTYSQYVFSTGLVAFGLFKRNIWFIGLGLAGSLVNYMITAEKAGIRYPVFIVSLFAMMKSKRKIFRDVNLIAVALAAILYLSVRYYHSSGIAEFAAWYFGMRTALTPGAFILHYMDFFSYRGYTYFSHVRGLDLFIPVPEQFANDARWPSIGIILGEDHFGFQRLNANANFIASDGIASLGLLGIPLAVVTFGFFLRLLDRISRGIGDLAVVLLVPVALMLTNGSLLTVITSFGGLFWIAAFQFAFPVKDGRRGVSAFSWRREASAGAGLYPDPN